MPSTSKLSSLTLNQIPKELFLVLGGVSGSDQSEFNPNFDPIFAKRISNNEKIFIGENYKWQSGKYYIPWSDGVIGNYYVLNSSNSVVYLCVSNNINNKINFTENVSSVIPTHTTPTVNQLSDGYSWIPIFKIDPKDHQYITNSDLPLPTISIKPDYSSFIEKYKPLCGTGITSFGCCCLYFKENSIDEITEEVYLRGDVTNETIFSECYECQKLAENLDREVIFMSGYTAGSIISSNFEENPLCPSTKQLKGTLEQLEDNKYETIPGSSNEFAYNLLNNFTNSFGILYARINLSSLTSAQKLVTTANPIVNIIDPTGSGAVVRLKTTQISENSYEVIGIEVISSGSNYGGIPDHIITNLTSSNPLNNAITLGVFPEGIFEEIYKFVFIKSYKIITSINTNILLDSVAAQKLTKFAILANPSYLDNNSPIKNTDNNSDYFSLEEAVICGVSGATPAVLQGLYSPPRYGIPINYSTYMNNTSKVYNTSKSSYTVYYTAGKTSSTGKVNYLGENGQILQISGVVLYVNDTKNSISLNDVLLIDTTYYKVIRKETPIINKISGQYLSSGILTNNVTNSSTETTKSYTFIISINTV